MKGIKIFSSGVIVLFICLVIVLVAGSRNVRPIRLEY